MPNGSLNNNWATYSVGQCSVQFFSKLAVGLARGVCYG